MGATDRPLEHESSNMSIDQTAGRVRATALVRLVRSGMTIAAVTLLTASACGGNGTAPSQSEDPVPNLDLGVARAWQARPTIVQTLRLLNPGLRTGDTLKLESVLKNVSNQPVSIEHVVCELDLEGDLRTEAPFILCVAYSVRGTLAPGEQTVGTLQRRIVSEPGRYTIRIRHLLDPAVWVPAELTVRAR
jgi:hypothetical protein